MNSLRNVTRSPLAAAGLAVLLATTFALWAIRESRHQRSEIEAALRTEARLVAEALGPALANAATSVRELEELMTWKLLDNALLLAPRRELRSDRELIEILGMNGLSSLVWLDRQGDVYKSLGLPIPPEFLGELARDVAAGRSDEALLGSVMTPDGDDETHGVAVARPTGGALIVAARSSSLFAFDRRIGLQSLLESMVETDAILFLDYRETPAGLGAAVVWDRGEVPRVGDGELAEIRGENIYGVEVEVNAPEGVNASVLIGLDADPLVRAADAAWRRTLLVGLAMVALSLAAAAFGYVQQQRAREQKESRRALAELERRRRRSERLAAAGTLAAGLAHEVRNPLNAISLAAQRIERRSRAGGMEAIESLARQTRQEVANLDEVLRGFLDLASPGAHERKRTNLREVADDVARLLQIEASEKSVRLGVDGKAVEAEVDADGIRRALLNLVRNAVEASPEGGTVDLSVSGGNGHATLEVADRGHGLDEESRERAFEAFYTRSASGTGLGLAIVERIVEEHQGSAGLDGRSGGGCRAWIRLPVALQDSGDSP